MFRRSFRIFRSPFSAALLLLLSMASACAVEMKAVTPQKAYSPLSPQALEELVGPIALYPDDLVAIVLPASTFPLQVVQAARFREQNPDGTPSDRWDSSVVALLNYPEVLKKLNNDLDWTWRLGEAVINQQPDVVKAVSGFRERARVAGNLKSDERQVVEVREKIVYIRPVSERVIYVPYYDPWEVTSYRSRRAYHYYPEPYPVYYYPYDDFWDFPSRHFWGVSSWYGIGWNHHRVHWVDHRYRHHPYYGRSYRDHGRYRRYRHREAPAYVHQPVAPVVADGVPVLPEDSIWQPSQQAGSRPFGDRREHTENPVGPIGGYGQASGNDSGTGVPQDGAAPAPSTAAGNPGISIPASEITGQGITIPGSALPSDPQAVGAPQSNPQLTSEPTQDTVVSGAPVVYEGDINGEQVRIIQRGSTFDRQSVDSPVIVNSAPEPVVHQALEPTIYQAPASSLPEGARYGSEHEAAVQAAIERAREQAREQSEVYERERAGGFGSPSFENREFENRVEETRSAPVYEERREVIDHQPTVHESRGGWGNDAAIEEAISRARDQGFGGDASPRHEPQVSEPSWARERQEEVQDYRREERFEAPSHDWGRDRGDDNSGGWERAREERSEPSYSEPSYSEPSYSEPERQEEFRPEDIQVNVQ